MLVSFVSTADIAAFWGGREPKEASRIACDGNEEDECLHLRLTSRHKAFDGRFKAVMRLEISEGVESLFKRRIRRARRFATGLYSLRSPNPQAVSAHAGNDPIAQSVRKSRQGAMIFSSN